MKPNRNQGVKLLFAVMAAGAVVLAVLAVALGQERIGTSTVFAGMTEMTRGQTVIQSAVTTTTEPTTLAASMARPTMKAARPRGFG